MRCDQMHASMHDASRQTVQPNEQTISVVILNSKNDDNIMHCFAY